MQKYYDVIVIGSGFGGSVSALRLAEAGKSVLVLERGHHFRAGDFPRDPTDVSSALWRYPQVQDDQGLFELRFFSDIGVVSASGVGGGSLVYANVNLRPQAQVFADPAWPESITRDTLEPYYQKVEQELGLSPVPDDTVISKREQFVKAGKALGATVYAPGLSVDWSKCTFCSECEFGCQYDAKNSLDKTYLRKAVQKGAEIRANAYVYMIEPAFHGYSVHFRDLKKAGRKTQIKTAVVILAAGTLGSCELLLRNKHLYDTLPLVSDALGKGFSANGDFLGTIQNSEVELEPWYGTDVTDVLGFSLDGQDFTVAAPGFNKPSMEVIAAMGQVDNKLLSFFGPVLWKHLQNLFPWLLSKGALSQPVPWRLPYAGPAERCTNLFAIGRDNAGGVVQFHRNRIDIRWDYFAENQRLVMAMSETMQALAEQYGGTFASAALWNMAKKTVTVHPLGGCRMADDPAHGVVSSHGEVHGHPGLYVADGSIIPAALGFHPAMTIAALAERNMAALQLSL